MKGFFKERRKALDPKDLSGQQSLLAVFAQAEGDGKLTDIENLLKSENQLNPYCAVAGQNTAFAMAIDAGNIKSAIAMYNHRPDENHKILLLDLIQQELLKEIQQEEPDLKLIKEFLRLGADPYKPYQGQDSAFEQAYKKELDLIDPDESLMDCLQNNNVSKNTESLKQAQDFAYKTIENITKNKTAFDRESVASLVKLVDPYERVNGKISLFESAYYTGNEELKTIILDVHDNRNIENNLELATQIENDNPSLGRIKTLLENGADPSFIDVNGQTAIDKAIAKIANIDDLELANVIVPDNKKSEYAQSLQDAAQNMFVKEMQKSSPDIATIKVLLDRKVDPYAAKEGSKSPFEILYYSDYPNKEKLIDFIQDEIPNDKIYATLQLGSELQKRSVNLKVVNELLRDGADPFYRSEGEYGSAYIYAKENKHWQAIVAIANHMSSADYDKIPVINEEIEKSLSEEVLAITTREYFTEDDYYNKNSETIASKEEFEDFVKNNRAQIYKDAGKSVPENEEMRSIIGKSLKKDPNDQAVLDEMIRKGITLSEGAERELLEQKYYESTSKITRNAAKILFASDIKEENDRLKKEAFSQFLASNPQLGGDIDDKNSSSRVSIDFALNNIETSLKFLEQVVAIIPEELKEDVAKYLSEHNISDPKNILAINDNIEKLSGKAYFSDETKFSLSILSNLITDKDKENIALDAIPPNYEKIINLQESMITIQKEDWEKLPANFKSKYGAIVTNATEQFIQKQQKLIKTGDIAAVSVVTRELNYVIENGARLLSYRIHSGLQKDPQKLELNEEQLKRDANKEQERRFTDLPIPPVISYLVNDRERLEAVLSANPYLGSDPLAGDSIGGLALDLAINKIEQNPKDSKMLENLVTRINQEYDQEVKESLVTELALIFQELDIDQQNAINKIITKVEVMPFISVSNLTSLWHSDRRAAEEIIASANEKSISNALIAYSGINQEKPINSDLYNKMYSKLKIPEDRARSSLHYINIDKGHSFNKILQDKNFLLRFLGDESIESKIRESFSTANFENKKLINEILVENKLKPLLNRELLLGYVKQSSDKPIPDYVKQHITEENKFLVSLSEALKADANVQFSVNQIIANKLEGKAQDQEIIKFLNEELKVGFKYLSLETKLALNDVLMASGRELIVNEEFLSELYSSGNNIGFAKAIIGMLPDDKKAEIVAQTKNKNLQNDLGILTETVENQISIALSTLNIGNLSQIIEDNKGNARELISRAEPLTSMSLEARKTLNNLLIENDIESIVNIEILESLSNEEINHLIETLSPESLSDLIDEASQKTPINPQLIAKLARKFALKNPTSDKDLGLILKDSKNIDSLSPDGIKAMAEFYDPKNHSPHFLKRLIDIHDVANSNIMLSLQSDLAHNKHFNSFDDIKKSAFKKGVDDYIKTKHSFFKKFFRNQDKKIEKRIAQAANSALDITPDLLQKMYNDSSKKAKVIKLISKMPKKTIEAVIGGIAAETKLDPKLAAAIYNRAMVEKIKANEHIAGIVLQDEKAIGKLSKKSVIEITEQYYVPDTHKDKILQIYIKKNQETSRILSGAKLLEAIGIYVAPEINVSDIKRGISIARKENNVEKIKIILQPFTLKSKIESSVVQNVSINANDSPVLRR